MTDTVSRRSALRLLGGAIAVASAATTGLVSPTHAYAQARPEAGAGPRVEGLLARLTLDEKISPCTAPPTRTRSARPATSPASPA